AHHLRKATMKEKQFIAGAGPYRSSSTFAGDLPHACIEIRKGPDEDVKFTATTASARLISHVPAVRGDRRIETLNRGSGYRCIRPWSSGFVDQAQSILQRKQSQILCGDDFKADGLVIRSDGVEKLRIIARRQLLVRAAAIRRAPKKIWRTRPRRGKDDRLPVRGPDGPLTSVERQSSRAGIRLPEVQDRDLILLVANLQSDLRFVG